MTQLFKYFNTENRVYYHILYWFSYYSYRVMIYGDIKNTYENVAYVQALELILKVAAVYFVLYYLKPLFFKTKKYFKFSISLILTVCIAAYIQLYIIWLCLELGIWDDTTTYDMVFSKWRYRSALGHINWIVIISLIVKVVKEAYENAEVNTKLINEKLATELRFLKSQVNPHFFFNTLNNLYSLTQKKSDKAPEVVLKLSELMSYIIYDTSKETVSFKKERSFMENYVELEKLRYGDFLEVNFRAPDHLDSVQVPPLLFIPFIENAFTHGVAKGGKNNSIDIQFDLIGRNLTLKVVNSISADLDNKKEKGGVGLKNINRRLELLYPKKHKLTLDAEKDKFVSDLRIDLDGLVTPDGKD